MAERVETLTLRDGTALTTYRTAPAGEVAAAMVLVHGVAEHAGRWRRVAEVFNQRGYEVWRFDLRGHGRSGGPRLDLRHFDQLVDDLGEVVAAVTAQAPLVIYAHSLGGLVATLHAESGHPQPAAYVLSAPSLAANLPRIQLAAARVAVRVAPSLRVTVPVEGHQLSRLASVGEAYFADPDVQRRATVRFGVESTRAMTAAAAALSRIAVPTLVVHGGDDTLVPTLASAPLAGVPGVERRVFPGLRHEMHNEPEAGEVLGFVAGWLEQVLGGGAGAGSRSGS